MWMIPVILFVLAASLLYWHFKKQFQFFKELGIGGPEPSFPLGNLSQVGSDGFLEPFKRWKKQYGKIYGYFEGPTPVLVVSDPDVLKNIFVTDFNNFRERKPFPLVPRDPKGLFVAKEERWRWLRPLLSPSFTVRKIKSMSYCIDESVDTLLEVMDETCQKTKPGTAVDVHKLFQCLTLDVIGKVAFGFQPDSLRNPNDRLLKTTQRVFAEVNASIWHILAMVLPFFKYQIADFKNKIVQPLFGKTALQQLGSDLKEIMSLRRAEKSTERIDFLQLMLNAQKEGKRPSFSKLHQNRDDLVECEGEGDHWDDEPNVHDMISEFTDEDIMSQAFTILLAGYETTANMLGFSAYLLGLNPDIQSRLCEEIDSHIPSNEVATCENTEKLPYLDMVVNEVLRMYGTAGTIISRKSKEARTYGSLHIPAGTGIAIDMWDLHYDPDYWPEPHKFDPERFTTSEKAKRHPYAFIPFGGGPRNCIGMRFALIEMKVVLVRVLQKFTFHKTSETEIPLSLRARTAIVPKNGVLLEVVPRS